MEHAGRPFTDGHEGTTSDQPLGRRRVSNDHLAQPQARILKCIKDWIAAHGETPSAQEIGQAVGLPSRPSVAYQSTGWNSLGHRPERAPR
ncbi:LexA family protein [Streptomyces spiralis]